MKIRIKQWGRYILFTIILLVPILFYLTYKFTSFIPVKQTYSVNTKLPDSIVNTNLDKIVNNELTIIANKNKIDTMNSLDITIIIIILSSLATFAGIIYNPILKSRHDSLLKLITSNDKTNTDEHTKIFSSLTASQEMLNYYTSKREICHGIRKIINDSLIYCTNTPLSEYINLEGNAIIDFCEDILGTGLAHVNKNQLLINIHTIITHSNTDCIALLGKDFADKIKEKQEIFITKFGTDTVELKADSFMNSKNNRFRVLSELFTQDYISFIIKTYYNK